MIEIINKKKKKVGLIEGGKYFDKKHRLVGYLDENTVKSKNGHTLLQLDEHDDIWAKKEQVGFILNSKIYFREEPTFEFSEEKRELYTSDGKNQLILEGNHEKINILDFFAIAIIFLKSKWSSIIYGY